MSHLEHIVEEINGGLKTVRTCLDGTARPRIAASHRAAGGGSAARPGRLVDYLHPVASQDEPPRRQLARPAHRAARKTRHRGGGLGDEQRELHMLCRLSASPRPVRWTVGGGHGRRLRARRRAKAPDLAGTEGDDGAPGLPRCHG